MLMFSLGLALLAGIAADIFSFDSGDGDGVDHDDAVDEEDIASSGEIGLTYLFGDGDVEGMFTQSDGSFVGTPEHDWFVGTDNRDAMSGGAGDDMLIGEAGDDTLIGDEGNDFLAGGEGSDVIFGGSGADFLDGSDRVVQLQSEIQTGDMRGDYLSGGDGDDVLVIDSGDTAEGGEGADVFVVDGEEYLRDDSVAVNDDIGYAEITDFSSEEDRIIITCPDDYSGDQVISIEAHPDQPDVSIVALDGVTVALVRTSVDGLTDRILVLPSSSFEPAHIGVGGAWR